MTKRLYYTDSYTTTFDAHVIEHTTHNGSPAVVLDQSCFYPTSGGQPHDTGTLDAVPVIDVVVREADGTVLHVLDRPLAAAQVTGSVDWERRFDHMRHHTGQHILSQAFIRVAGAKTIGFHMSADSITIDLDTPDLDPATIDTAEDLANRVVSEDRPVRAWFPAEDELAALELRKVPAVDGKLRLVDIQGFDVTACGGTHVARTGAIGIIKVLRADRRGDTQRVEFRCGTRALHDYREKNALLHRLAAELTTGYWDIPAALDRLRDENKALQRELRALRKTLLEHEAAALWESAERCAGYALITRAFEDRDAGDVRQLAQTLITRPQTVVICGIAGEKAHLIAARSGDLTVDMVPVLMRGLAAWGVARGGGRPSFAQGGGTSASPADVEAALAAAAALVDSSDSE
jgi:alanyl-tRNA synthetase